MEHGLEELEEDEEGELEEEETRYTWLRSKTWSWKRSS